MDGSRSGFAYDLFTKDELPDHTAESTKDIILSNAPSLDETLAEDKYKQNLRKLEIVPSIRRHGEQRRLTSLVPFGEILGRARHFGGRYAFKGSNKALIECRLQAMAANWSALRGFWFARSPWSHRRLIFMSRIVSASITGLDACAASPGELNRLDKNLCRNLKAHSEGRAYDSAATESRAQLDQRSAPSQVESAPRTSRDRNQKSKMGAGNDEAQPRTLADNGGDLGTASRRGTNIDGRGVFYHHQRTHLRWLSSAKPIAGRLCDAVGGITAASRYAE